MGTIGAVSRCTVLFGVAMSITSCAARAESATNEQGDPPGVASQAGEPLCGPAKMYGFGLGYMNGHCDGTSTCARSKSIEISSGGRVRSIIDGRKRECQIGAEAVTAFARVATRADVVAALRVSPMACPLAPDVASETIQMELAQGLFVRTETGGCNLGPISDLRNAAWMIAELYPDGVAGNDGAAER